ncbi:ferrous iron transport protein B [Flavonifractor sp. AGMB03687]|uniref:ferrous iron transport protein B n=1 Tax=Flavonifractor sp. AGMB03687 TaxID=2785133 RepID=UPI001ADFFEF4|nr:ferrous iron transport protein B [Flavonifractor sp. AGMB03687]
MGLTRSATGPGAAAPPVRPTEGSGPVVALAGNPNVGKSTLFNALTGLRQHTGNWPGKTVEVAQGQCLRGSRSYTLVDLPGTYSLLAHSAEEEVSRDFLCFGGAQGAVVVCDATCLERNLNLVLQTLELEPRTLVCVNLLDEAARKHIQVDLPALSAHLGVPVAGISAGREEGLEELLDDLDALLTAPEPPRPRPVRYPPAVEFAAASLRPLLEPRLQGKLDPRWTALRLLEGDPTLPPSLARQLGWDPRTDHPLQEALTHAREQLAHSGVDDLGGALAASLVQAAHEAAAAALPQGSAPSGGERLDRLLTSRATGVPAMLLLLAAVLWLTIEGANYPSQLLSTGLFWVQDRLTDLFLWLGAPEWLHGALVLGVYRVLAWVISVMLPPMAIFFPLFTLLEDFGYLPRVAFLLDHAFQKAKACGKQALTMCMGFGCNAAGVVGCRIIDSPRERLIAILTNSFVPCNGRFPTLIALIAMFFVGTSGGWWQGLASTLLLTAVILLGVVMTFAVSRLLSGTLLKGLPSAYALELPPYRKPRVGQVLVRSVLDRTLFVLGRAVAVAAPAGLVIWLCANVTVGGTSILNWCTGFLDPLGQIIGLDGTILMAFLLGFPANEIVIPIILMSYLSTGTIQDTASLDALRELLVANGWTWLTALCTMLFSLFHWPCSTTCLTIARETRSVRWTLLSVALPAGLGMGLCFLVASAVRLLGLA